MCANDTESKQRIERHRRMRADKSFQTIEVFKEIGSIAVPSNSVVLLECLSNLLANEMFSSNTAVYSVSSLLQEIRHLQSHCQHLIVVSNEIFSDGICYDLSTTQYLSDLGYLHRELCRTANEIYEVVCGIPISHRKGGVMWVYCALFASHLGRIPKFLCQNLSGIQKTCDTPCAFFH